MKLRSGTQRFLSALAVFIVFAAGPALSQRRNVQSGSIELESEDKQLDPYTLAQTSAESFVNGLLTTLSASPAEPATVAPPADNALRYLGAVYLLCSIKRGPCPAVLEAILEVDLINSHVSHTPACPTMKRFWKQYIEGDHEKRLQFSTQTGFVAAFSEFNQKVRPQFLKCEQTIKEKLAAASASKDFFRTRYVAGKPPLSAIKATSDMLAEVKQKKVNVFSAVGLE